MVQYKNSEGEISASEKDYTYQVVPVLLPGAGQGGDIRPNSLSTDILNLYNVDSGGVPYASALIGMDGRILAFYQTGGIHSSTSNRLLGYALRQNP